MVQLSSLATHPLKINYLSVDELIPNPRNSRTHSEKQISKLSNIIKEFGFNDPVHIGNDNVLICGHARLQAAKLAGLKEIPTVYLGHLSKTQQKAYLIAHNRIATEAGWDNDIIKEDLIELRDLGFDLELTGFEQDEIDIFTDIDNKTMGLVDADELPDVKALVEAVTKPGDIWILGNHRVMCGDSTMVDNVLALVDKAEPVLMVTDPPYGVNYDPEWRDGADLGVGERSRGKVENDDNADWSGAYSLFTGSVVYVWHASFFTHLVARNLIDCGYEIVSNIIWSKQHFALSRGDYHWQHEPCWYMVRKGHKHNWQGARDQATVWQIKNNNSFGNATPEKTWGHGTQKPVECMERPIINNTKANDSVYDPFGGSGTTLIACEKTNRKCLMMEISPQYCDTIVLRWQHYSGKKAVLESTGELFEEIGDGKRLHTNNA